MDVIQGLIKTENVGRFGWRIVNNNGIFGLLNSRTSNVTFSILNDGVIGASSNIPSNIINSNSNINIITNYTGVSGGGSSQFTTSGTKIYYNLGNIGIGTTDPIAPLHIYNSIAALPPEISVVGAASTTIGNFDRCIVFPYSGTATTKDYTFTTTEALFCDILVVGGGGSGSETHGGGGGAGAVIFMTNVNMNGSYTIKVGKGGVCQVTGGFNGLGRKGNDSEIFKTDNVNNKIVAEGGGGGGQLANANGGSGGSGGGGDAYNVAAGVGGAATPYTPILDGVTGIKYGNNGGNAFGNPGHGGGGGGAGGVGENVLAGNNSGNVEAERAHGGIGIKSATINSINYDFKTLFGTNTGCGVLEADGFLYFGGGGGGGRWESVGTGNEGGNGGLGGGGKGGWGGSGVKTVPNNGQGYPGINGTGGGGGGGGDYTPAGGDGGSGIVIIRYRKATSTSSARLLLDTTTTGTASVEFRRGIGVDAQNDYRIINDSNGYIKLLCENSTQSFADTTANLAWFSSNETIIHKNTAMNGRVGIGTTYHATRSLDVVGSANISGTVSVGGLSVSGSSSSNVIITNSLSSNVSLTISNGFVPPAPPITSSPSATEIGITGLSTYQVFTYTTETAGAGTRQTLYTLNVATGGAICDILMIGGGGAGGQDIGGGGGGGAVLYGTNISIASGTYQIKVGDGAVAGEVRGKSTEGFGATILGGGCAGNALWNGATTANSGGSGSGGKSVPDATSRNGGTVGSSTKGTILASATLYNGNTGGTGVQAAAGNSSVISSGGAGANAVGGNGQTGAFPQASGVGSSGGAGVSNTILGTTYFWGGGGGGGSYGYTIASNGGAGGGGAGQNNNGAGVTATGNNGASSFFEVGTAINGINGTGGGGGGVGYLSQTAGNGGSGIVIVRYLSPSSSSTIELVRGTTSDSNRDYKIGNYGGEFKVISSTSGVDTDYIRITTSGAIFNPTGTASWNTGSDRRIKENIERASYDKCYENINKLELNRFNYIDGFNTVSRDNKQLGFIAQEVYDIFPKAISSHEYYSNTLSIPDLLSIDVSQINYSLYGAVKKLIEINNEKDKRIKTLDYQLKTLEAFLNISVDNSSNITIDTSNITIDTSNISLDTSNIAIDTSNITIDTSNISLDTSNIIVDTSNIIIDTSNITIDTSNITIDTSNIAIDTSNITIDTSNISLDTSNIAIDTSNITIDTSNIAIDTSNIAIDTSNIAIDTSNIIIDTSNISIDT
uniref:Peptidase S74 domain-containing protein n=1 Tax=viral metagenome TaxID=1070528 RepID=A0A6C0LCW3_9ZZZZ